MSVHILVVDDESEIREMLYRHFRYQGYEVETAAEGNEALEKLSSAKIDIVISDIMMPGMDGIDLLKAIRDQYPMIHTIMITGYVTLENALACMRRGADTLLFKPLVDLTLLDRRVAMAVQEIKHWVELLRELQAMKNVEVGTNS